MTASPRSHRSDARPVPPAVRPRRRRSDRARANDVRILAAALTVLRSDGYDGLGMSHVARAAGLNSTGALYGRFENMAELAVWAWTETAWDALRSLSERVVALLDLADSDADHGQRARLLADELTAPTDELRAAFELLAVAARVEELDEVVRPDVEALLGEFGALPDGTPRRRAQVLGQLSLAWGIGLLSMPPTAPPMEWWLLVLGSVGLAHDRTRPRRPATPVPLPSPTAATGEPVRDVVLEAAAEVVARTGFDRATVARIARRAGYSTGVIYEYYDRKDDMIAELVEVLLEALYSTIEVRDGDLISEGRMAELSGSLLAAHVQPEARPVQRLKVELYLAAAHQPDVAAALGGVLVRHNRHERDRLVATGLSPVEAALAPAAGRAIDHGIALVDGAAGPLLDVDWRLYIEPLVRRNT